MTATELSIIDIKNPLVVFSTPKGLDPFIDQIEAQVKKAELDISTEEGRAAIRSLAFKVAKSKTALDKMGKELTEEQRALIASVNEERRRVRERLEKLQEEVRKPLTDWENAEKERVAAHEAAISYLMTADKWEHPATMELVEKRLADLTPFYEGREWQEFKSRASALYDHGKAALQPRLADMVKAEKEAAELTRLRAAEQERMQKEREEEIAAKAAEVARLEAERKGADQIAELEAKRKQEADAAAQRDREAAEALKKAESDRLEAEKRAEDERKAAEERAVAAEKAAKEAQAQAERNRIAAAEKAKADQEAAVEAERQRVAAAQEVERKAAAAREADKAHKAKINNEALQGLLSVIFSDDPDVLTEFQKNTGKNVVKAIASGQIAHVKITY
jgi:colicin import membrane protein